MIKINRRDFLKIVGTTTAIAMGIDLAPISDTSEFTSIDSTIEANGVLTQEMLENAIQQSQNNFGSSEILLLNEQDYKILLEQYPAIKDAVRS